MLVGDVEDEGGREGGGRKNGNGAGFVLGLI